MAKPTELGGKHSVTAAVKNVLAAQGVVDPHTGQPFTEAMLLGIGGGLGMGYILFEFKHEESANVVLGFRNRWNYLVQFMTNLIERLGGKVIVHETSSRKAADKNLTAALKAGPAIAWVDKAHLPHLELAEALKGYGMYTVGVYEIEEGQVLVDDHAKSLISVPADVFADGRARIGSDKNRILQIVPPSSIDLSGAITAGIQDIIEHLGSDSESFSLPAISKWAKLMTHSKDKKGWKVVFKERKGLYNTLLSVYEDILYDDSDGAGLRSLYADFLKEAAVVLNKPALNEAEARYRDAAQRWRELGEAALPDSGSALKEAKDLLSERYARLGQSQPGTKIMERLEALKRELNPRFPMDEPEVDGLFTTLQNKVDAVYEAECAALETLKRSM